MTFVNSTGLVAQVISQGTTNLTGDLFSILLLILLMLIVVAVAFRISLEFIVIIFMPMVIVLMAYYSEWYVVGGVFLIFLAVLFARNFFVQSN
jgi:hypothetical protein